MSTRPVLGVMATMRGLSQLGENPAAVLQRYGLSLDEMDPGARIDRALELKLYMEVAKQLRDPAIGLKLGEFMSFAAYGPLTMLLMSCAGTREAIGDGIRYQALSFLYSRLSFEPGPRYSALVLLPPRLDGASFRFRIDTEMSGTFKLINDLQATIGMRERPSRVDLPYPRPADAAAYAEHYGCEVRFDQDAARFWMSNEFLQLKFPTADTHAHTLYCKLCEQQIAAQEEELKDLPEQICNYLKLFRGRLPDAAQVSQFFGLSERSLRRRLSEKGTSLRELIGTVRCDKACQLLSDTRLSVEAISEQLGYAEPAAFIHAFRRWSGTTPRAWREQPSVH